MAKRIYWLHDPIGPAGWWTGLAVTESQEDGTVARERRYIPISRAECLTIAQQWNAEVGMANRYCAIGQQQVTPLEFLNYLESVS